MAGSAIDHSADTEAFGGTVLGGSCAGDAAISWHDSASATGKGARLALFRALALELVGSHLVQPLTVQTHWAAITACSRRLDVGVGQQVAG